MPNRTSFVFACCFVALSWLLPPAILNASVFWASYGAANATTIPWGQLATHAPILLDVSFLLIALALVYTVPAAGILFIVHSATKANPIICILTTSWIGGTLQASANIFFFPNSQFNKLIEPITDTHGWTTNTAVAAATFIFLILKFVWINHSRLKIITLPAYLLAFLMIATLNLNNKSKPQPVDNIKKPNVILIGLDSFRPDFIDELSDNSTLKHHLQSSTIFDDAITPMARTHSALTSALTGNLPGEHGAIANLTPETLINSKSSIAHEFRDAGYTTFFSTDEKRFSNINQDYGFDVIHGPRTGALDFVLPYLLDAPLVNLSLMLRPTAHLFPYLYNNRAASVTYDPNNYAADALKALIVTTKDKPFFSLIHLCTAHWPYDTRFTSDTPTPPLNKYKESLQILDEQVKLIFEELDKNNKLNNSWVVLFSDHGEGLGDPSDDMTMAGSEPPHNAFSPEGRNPGGHGSDVFSRPHNAVLLAFRHYYAETDSQNAADYSTAPTTLIDIAPTMRDLVGLPARDSDGRSLARQIRQADSPSDNRPRILETGVRFRSLVSESISPTLIATEGNAYYRLKKYSQKIELRPERLHEVVSNKQFAVELNETVYSAELIEGEWTFSAADWKQKTWRRVELKDIPKIPHEHLCDYLKRYPHSPPEHFSFCG